MQQGQVFSKGPSNWAYRYRLGGRDSKRMQRSGFPTKEAAEQALDRALERARQEQGLAQTPTLSELVEIYLAQHDTEPETVDKLRWLLEQSTAAFGVPPISELQPGGDRRLADDDPPTDHRFEATKALRQSIEPRAVPLGMINRRTPPSTGHREPQRPARSSNDHSSPGTSSQRLADTARPTPRSDRPVRSRDRAQAERVARARAPRPRPGGRSPLRTPRVPKRPHQTPENRRQLPRRPAPGDRARRARRAPETNRVSAPLPRPARRLPRPAQLPLPRLETRPARPRNRPDPARLRSQAHLRDVRAARRHLHLRPLPLHGRQPDDDRPPLRAPRQRRPPARDRPPRQLQRQRDPWTRWTRSGRARRRPRPTASEKPASKQDIRRSPLSDSNRRPLPYHACCRRKGVCRELLRKRCNL